MNTVLSIYTKGKNNQNESLLLELTIVVTFGEERGEMLWRG